MEDPVELRKRMEELLRIKKEVERKMNSAYKSKSLKLVNSKDLDTIKEEDTVTLDMKWDNTVGRLVVLQSDRICIKEFKKVNTRGFLLIELPEKANEYTSLLVENGCISVSLKTPQGFNNYTYIHDKETWKLLEECALMKLECIYDNSNIYSNLKQQTFLVTNNVTDQIEDVKMMFKSAESAGTVLFLKTGGFLSIYNIHAAKETVYFPNISSRPTFNAKSIVYYNYNTDATLFLVLHDRSGGKVRVFVCGADTEGANLVASIPIPKDNLWLKVCSHYIVYQDPRKTVHILSLFTLEEVNKFDLQAKFQSFCMINENNLVFTTINGEFIYLNL